MLKRWCQGAYSNKDVCELSWWHTLSGGAGVTDFAMDPEAHGDNHARKVREALKLEDVKKHLFRAWVPQWDENTETRVIAPLAIKLPHEALVRDVAKFPDAYDLSRRDPRRLFSQEFHTSQSQASSPR